jgi:hypothetical protein
VSASSDAAGAELDTAGTARPRAAGIIDENSGFVGSIEDGRAGKHGRRRVRSLKKHVPSNCCRRPALRGWVALDGAKGLGLDLLLGHADSGPEAREQALVFVALCVGGMVLARGIDDRALGDELRKSAERHILAMTGWEDGQRH